MYRISVINRSFFNSKKILSLITSAALGISIVIGTKSNKKYYGEYNGNLVPKYEDKLVWENYIPENTQTVHFLTYPSDYYKVRFLKESLRWNIIV